jgi:hypothetical protein
MRHLIIKAATLEDLIEIITEKEKLAYNMQGGISFDGTAYFCVMIKKEYETK